MTGELKLEVGTTLFSDLFFDWRRLNIGNFECRDNLPESTVRGGVFHYRQGPGQPSAHSSTHCRNRSIIWLATEMLVNIYCFELVILQAEKRYKMYFKRCILLLYMYDSIRT